MYITSNSTDSNNITLARHEFKVYSKHVTVKNIKNII